MKVTPFLICGFYKDKTNLYIVNYIPQVHCLWIYVHFLLFSELKPFHFISNSNILNSPIIITYIVTTQSTLPLLVAMARYFFTKISDSEN